MSILKKKAAQFAGRKSEIISLDEFLNRCKEDPNIYRGVGGKLLAQFGEPKRIDTGLDARLSRIHGNRVITQYPAFANEFFGLENQIQQIAGYLRNWEQNLEERKQILYLLGPVGSAKSSLAEKLKELYLNVEIARLVYEKSPGKIVPLPSQCHPFMVFEKGDMAELEEEYGIPKSAVKRRLRKHPLFVKYLNAENGDLSKFKVEFVNASEENKIGISQTVPGDENSQDITSLVGKVDIRKLETFAQDDPDAFSYSGGLNIGNQGIMEFVEMFKAPIKVLHPLLTATQEGNFDGQEGASSMPFDGLILAHSNESEWSSFRNNKNNEAFLDRVFIVKVPYNLQVDEEVKIYQKLLDESELKGAPCAPGTLESLAQMSVLSRLVEPENSSIFSKMRVYNGENMKDHDPKAKSAHEYRDYAGVDEGMQGLSTRFAFKILSRTFNFDESGEEIAANPVHLFQILEKRIIQEQFPQEVEELYLSFLKGYLIPNYVEQIGQEIQECYLESYDEYGQNLFDRYVTYADFWIQDQDYRDPDTGQIFDREALNAELETTEKPAGISNPKDFRHEIVNFCLRARANNEGKNPSWKGYEKLRAVIEKKMFSNTEDLLPVISFSATTGSKEDADKQQKFVQRMVEKGYTEKQVRLLCEWYGRHRQSN